MYKYILFDLDGTLTDPAAGIIKSLRHSLAEMGVAAEDEEKYRLFIGPPLQDSFRTLYGFNEEEVDRAIRLYRAHHGVEGLYENEVYPGVTELLRKLQAQGKKLYLATTKVTAYAELILQHFQLDKYFTRVIGGNFDGTRTAKAEIIAEILQEIPPAERAAAVMVGDRNFDLVGAKAHGLDAIAVTYGFGGQEELRAENPTFLVDSVAELAALLLASK